ncbi:hypothetical protein EFT49_08880 [Leuconostoc falkenbergense]|uniref:hypothetical protein n=1 Tax=Leuconostoc falkenbergense TaxID=2766470 RepID=UPI0021A9DA0E|nr:hypothetical protein [Leuconostoc falkenbergense]MCT4420296.1 hypothetical protein [Leuconostoc falkenbergense]
MGNVAVYKKGTTDFFSQGLGLLSDVVSSNLTQTVSSTGNVEQKLEVEYPIDGYLVSELVEGAILRVSVSTNKSDYGVFEIVDTLKDDSGTITVYGDPYYNRILRMSFDNGGVFTKFSSVQSALDAAKQNITGFPADFNLISNLNTGVDLSENTYDTFGTFLEALNSAAHGNIKYSLNSIQIYSAIGEDITDITLRDDMNTSSVKITTDFSGIINKVIPVLPVLDKDGNATDKTKVGTIVTSKYSNQFLDYWAGKVIHFDTQDLANTYFNRTHADRPVQTVDVDPIGLDDDFSTINIFDTIELYSTRLDYTDKLRVSERVFDTLSENVTSFKLGSSSVNIFNQINEQNDEIFNNVVKLTNAAISANGKGIDYFGQAKPSSPKEGNTWFWDDGTDFGIKQYTNGEWVDLVSSNTAEKIAASVTESVSQAKAHTDEVKQGLSSDIATATSQAASLANAAEASAKSEAVSQFNRAQSALSDAKTDLTKSIASEASQAVAAANSQAQNYVNQAKADALNTIAKEVTDRQNAVSALDSKATNAVNQAKSDITDTINALSVGGRNLYLNSRGLADFYGTNGSAKVTVEPFDSTTNMWHFVAAQGNGNYIGIWLGDYGNGKLPDNSDWSYSADIKGTGKVVQFGIELGDKNPVKGNIGSNWSRISQTGHVNEGFKTITMYFDTSDSPLDVYIKLPKLETGTIPTDWTPAPEDVVLDYTTKDNKIKETISQYKDTNDGKVRKAQTDATTALGLVTTKVSQTDYDKKTGDLATKYTQVKQTADSQATDIVDIKKTATSQASKINSISSDVDGTKQSISDINKTQDSQSDKINQITNDVNGTKQSITDIQTKDDKQDTRMGTIETSVSGIKSEFSSYKTTNDGVVKTAQTTAQTAVDGLKTKVSQTDYDKKTGQLQTDLTSTTQTANQAKTDIASIKQKDGEQDEKMNTIVSDANGTKQTVSDLKTAQDKQSGYISTLQQRADGFDATVTKVDNLSVGGRNLLIDSQTQTKYEAWYWGNGGWTEEWGTYLGSKINRITREWDNARYRYKDLLDRGVINTTDDFTYSIYFRVVGEDPAGMSYANISFISEATTKSFYSPVQLTNLKEGRWTRLVVPLKFKDIKYDPSQDWQNSLRVEASAVPKVHGARYEFAAPKLERGNIATDYTPAPEDVDSTIAKVKLTADESSAAISKLTSADGIITKVQADIKVNADAITQKVSKTDYDQKNGELSKKVNEAKDTADKSLRTIGDYKTSNDKRVQEAESSIERTANAITEKVSRTDYDKKTGDLTEAVAQVKHTADSISNFVRDSSGNISSNFQTALSKTSIITGSTLASSIQKQTATQISSALKDNNGKIISLINQDASGVQIAGNNIVLNGNTTVTGTFKVSQANIANGAIGTAQIGDATITSAKIADLDVAKITGNVSNFIQSNWNGVFASTTIDGSGMSIDAGNTTTKFDTTGAHYSNSSGMRATYSFGKWSDSHSNATSATGLYLGATGSSNGFINILGTSGAAALVLAGSTMDYGSNLNVMRGALNSYVNVNIREQLHFKGNKYNSPSYIEINESNRTFNFFTGGGSVGGGNYFYFNQKVISAGTFSSTSALSKKNIISDYEENALDEIIKTDLVLFEYKNRPGEQQISPIIDDINADKKYYIPPTIVGEAGQYVDMYSMISMAWKAIQQLNEKIGEK